MAQVSLTLFSENDADANVTNVKRLVKRVLTRLPRERNCECSQAAQFAVFTNPKFINKKTAKKLEIIHGKYGKR